MKRSGFHAISCFFLILPTQSLLTFVPPPSPFPTRTAATSLNSIASSPRQLNSNSNGGGGVKESSSSELLSLLIEHWKNNSDSSLNLNDQQRVQELIKALVERKVQFNPNECIFGDFFMTVYFSGSKIPLWEKISQVSPSIFGKDNPRKRKNIKGQKYYVDNDDNSVSKSTNDAPSSSQGRVINYAEVFGKTLQLRAYGGVALKSSIGDAAETLSSPPSSISSTNNKFNDMISFLTNPFETKAVVSKSLLQCPIDYIATIEKGTIVFFNNELDIKIEGTGTVRVLYADPNMRIFVNVGDNTDDRWEKDGLCVVQIRSDLIDPEWVL